MKKIILTILIFISGCVVAWPPGHNPYNRKTARLWWQERNTPEWEEFNSISAPDSSSLSYIPSEIYPGVESIELTPLSIEIY